jgi:hypothetical protein
MVRKENAYCFMLILCFPIVVIVSFVARFAFLTYVTHFLLIKSISGQRVGLQQHDCSDERH